MKIINVFIVIGLLITISSNIFSINGRPVCDPGDSYIFQDVEVFVFGRCRGQYSDGSWDGGLFIGDMHFAGVTSFDNFLERFVVFVRNQSSGKIIFKIRLQNSTIHYVNTSGIFFWGSKGSSVSDLKPIVFIRCHVEQVSIIEHP